jgi:hypothetical protein
MRGVVFTACVLFLFKSVVYVSVAVINMRNPAYAFAEIMCKVGGYAYTLG